MRNWAIGIGIVILLVLAYLGVQHFYWSPNLKKITDRCTDYNPQWEGMIDCYGVISIWQPHNSGYLIQNNTDPGPVIAQIASSNDFVVQGNEMYLIDITPKSVCNNLVPGKYCGDFQVNGQQKQYYYDSPSQVPTYLIINTQTGDEQFYVQPQDASSSAEAIFEELQKQQ